MPVLPVYIHRACNTRHVSYLAHASYRMSVECGLALYSHLKPLVLIHGVVVDSQAELSRNRVRSQRIDIWQQAVDTEIFNPRFRSHDMRMRLSDGHPDACILTYIGRLGAGGL